MQCRRLLYPTQSLSSETRSAATEEAVTASSLTPLLLSCRTFCPARAQEPLFAFIGFQVSLFYCASVVLLQAWPPWHRQMWTQSIQMGCWLDHSLLGAPLHHSSSVVCVELMSLRTKLECVPHACSLRWTLRTGLIASKTSPGAVDVSDFCGHLTGLTVIWSHQN